MFWMASALVFLWISGTIFSFWWFQFRPIRPFADEHAVVFKDDHIEGTLATTLIHASPLEKDPSVGTVATIFHFWDPDCSCNRFNEEHVRELMKKYKHPGLRFVIIARSRNFFDSRSVLEQAHEIFPGVSSADLLIAEEGMIAPPSSPAVAIVNGQGNLAYFGPYSVGAVCSSQAGAFVEETLDALLKGGNPSRWNILAVGCFCPWGTDSIFHHVKINGRFNQQRRDV